MARYLLRSRLLKRLLNFHSPSEHILDKCWCKGTKREIFPEQYTAEDAKADMEAYYRYISEISNEEHN